MSTNDLISMGIEEEFDGGYLTGFSYKDQFYPIADICDSLKASQLGLEVSIRLAMQESAADSGYDVI